MLPTQPFLKLPRLQKLLILEKKPYISPETVKEIWRTTTPIKVDPPIRPPRAPVDIPDVTLQSPFPIPFLGQFPYIRFDGFMPTGIGLKTIQDVVFGEPKPKEVIIYPSPIIPFKPKIGEDVAPGAITAMTDVLGTTPGTPAPIIPAIMLPKWPEFPDVFGGLKEAGKWILIGGAALMGVVLLSSYLKGRQK